MSKNKINNENYKNYCGILELSLDHNKSEVKKQYYKLALKYHPDKSKGNDDKFKLINEAYEYLNNYHKNSETFDKNISFSELIIKVINSYDPNIGWSNIFVKTTCANILNHCEKYSDDIFNELDLKKSEQLYKFMVEFKYILSIPDDTLIKIKKIIQKKYKYHNIIIINPTLDDLLKDNVYKLETEFGTYYLPLWHNQIEQDISDSKLVLVKIKPIIEDNTISIDKYNNLHVKLMIDIKDLLKDDIKVDIHNKMFEINKSRLLITKNTQFIRFYKCGILKSNKNNIFDSSQRADIIFEINLF